MGSWMWMGRYALVLFAAVLLGTAIGELAVFKQTMLGTPKLSAATLIRLAGYGTALVVIALLGQRIAKQLQSAGTSAAHLGYLVFPITLLVVLSAGYDVVLNALRPFLSTTHKDAYNWMFVLGISACAVWLVARLNRNAEGLMELVRGLRLPRPRAHCSACGAALRGEAKFCAACGAAASEQRGNQRAAAQG